jgi:hypothetical protein
MLHLITLIVVKFSAASNTAVSAYPWERLADLFASLDGLHRVQLRFENRSSLFSFVEAQRAALNALDGRVELTYRTCHGPLVRYVQLDLITLAETITRW